MTTIEFIFDFGSPNAYLTHKVLPEFAQRAGAQVEIIPCLLGGIFKATNNKPPMVAYAEVPKKRDYDLLEFRRFIAKHGLSKFRMNPHFPVNTLILMRGAIVALDDDRLDDYVEAGLKAMWEDGLKMDDPAVFAEAMTLAGFEGAALLERTQDQAVKDRLAENTSSAVERGVFGVPTFFVGDEMFFGKERLLQVEEEARSGVGV